MDSKCDYPAACNAMETLLIHIDIFKNPVAFDNLTSSLKKKGVVLHPGPRLASLLPIQSGDVSSLRKEYGGLECSVELVNGVEEAVEVINTHGSSHTDTIVTESGGLCSSSFFFACSQRRGCMIQCMFHTP